MTRTMDRLAWPSLWVATFVFVGWGLVPRAALYTTVLSPARLVALAALIKMALLLLATRWSGRAWRSLEVGNPVRPAWRLLAAGLLCTLLGQAALAPYQLSGNESPFPSLADLFYVAAYPLIAAALVMFIRAYADTGFPIGTRGERAAVLGAATAVCVALAVPALRPVIEADAPAPAKALSAAYPLFDMALLVPLVLLLRITWRFRGGSLSAAWLAVLSGFVFLSAGDVLFAYFTALGRSGLDPFVHAAYILAYGLVAVGARRHLDLVRA